MTHLRCAVFHALPKELEEDVNKFLASRPCTVHHIVQSESANHISITIFYEPDEEVGDGEDQRGE
jgi:hypothetical protein